MGAGAVGARSHEDLRGGEVVEFKVKKVDLVNDTTSVDVRYRLSSNTTERDRSGRTVGVRS